MIHFQPWATLRRSEIAKLETGGDGETPHRIREGQGRETMEHDLSPLRPLVDDMKAMEVRKLEQQGDRAAVAQRDIVVHRGGMRQQLGKPGPTQSQLLKMPREDTRKQEFSSHNAFPLQGDQYSDPQKLWALGAKKQKGEGSVWYVQNQNPKKDISISYGAIVSEIKNIEDGYQSSNDLNNDIVWFKEQVSCMQDEGRRA